MQLRFQMQLLSRCSYRLALPLSIYSVDCVINNVSTTSCRIDIPLPGRLRPYHCVDQRLSIALDPLIQTHCMQSLPDTLILRDDWLFQLSSSTHFSSSLPCIADPDSHNTALQRANNGIAFPFPFSSLLHLSRSRLAVCPSCRLCSPCLTLP